MSETTNKQGCEIFFLNIGQHDEDSAQSGDAIVITIGNRFSSGRDDYKIIVVDGAFASDAKTIKEHLEIVGAKNASGKIQIDLMVSTHPDQDHVSGLIKLAEDDEIQVGELWIHGCNGFPDRTQCSISEAKDLIKVARKKGIPMREPFSDTDVSYNPEGVNACIEVLGPTKEYYDYLITSQEKIEIPGKRKSALAAPTSGLYSEVFEEIEEIFNLELLQNPDENATSNSNNSSAVLLLKFFKNNQLSGLALLTADAGVGALERILPELKNHSWNISDIQRFVQIPHHGSRRNVGPDFLDEMLGEREFGCVRGVCYVSAHKKDPSHPKVQVLNAFARRGYNHLTNEGGHIRYQKGIVPELSNWSSIDLIGLLPGEEEEEHD